MTRSILPESAVADDMQSVVAGFHADVIKQVEAAVANHQVVVVGMDQNPYCKKAKQLLDNSGYPYECLEYGSYFSQWKPRLAIKMWAGWPTFPMVFVTGKLIGGKQELELLLQSGALGRQLQAADAAS